MEASKHPHLPAKQSRSRKTLDAMLDAAERLLEEKSYTEVSMTELVAAAGVTTGAFYSRFESKNALLLSLYQRYLEWLARVVDGELEATRWRGLTRRARSERAAKLICRLYETRAGLLRAMVVFTRLDSAATRPTRSVKGASPSPQILLIQGLCDRLQEGLNPEERPAREDLEFAVYSALTLARETILFPGLPMAGAMRLGPRRVRPRLARLLEIALSRQGSEAS